MVQDRELVRVAVFGNFSFNMACRELRKSGIKMRLEDKPAVVLGQLIDNAGRPVTRQDLQKHLWPNGEHVDFNHGLNKSINKLRAVLGDNRDQPRYIETLSGRGYRFIAPLEILCEQGSPTVDPDSVPTFGPASGNAAAVPLLVLAVEPADHDGKWWWSRHPKSAIAAVTAGLLLLVFGAAFSRSRNAAGSTSRKTIAIVGFRDLSGRNGDAWLSTALTEWLTTDLAAGGQLRPVSSEEVAQIRSDLPLEHPDGFSAESLQRIRRHMQADLVVSGTFASSEREHQGQLRVDIRVQDAKSGELLDAISVNGRDSAVLDLTSQIGQRLRTDLGLRPLSTNALLAVGDILPRDPNAARLYSQGLEESRRSETRGAQEKLISASMIEPRNALIHSALSTTWSNLGYSRDALQEAQKAFDLSTELPLEKRLLIEGQLKEASYDWTGAMEVYSTLFGHYPDDTEYGLRLAAAETAGGMGAKALSTLERLRKAPSIASDDPRIDLAESMAAASISDFKRQFEAATRAVDKGRAQGRRLITARAEVAAGESARALGKPTDALALWNDAREKFENVGDQSAVARVLADEGRLCWQKGDPSGASKSYGESIKISKKIGDDVNLGRALTGLGQFQLYYTGSEASRRTLEEALSIFRRIGNREEEAYTLSVMADGIMPRYNDAKELYEKSLELSRAVNDRSRIAGRLMDLGIIATVQGELPTAAQNLTQALKIYDEIGEKDRVALQLNNLAIVLRWQGRLPEASQRAQQSISILSSLGEPVPLAEAQVILASIQLESGEIVDVEPTIYAAMENFRLTHDEGAVDRCFLLLADLRLAQHRYVDSRSALTRPGFDVLAIEPRAEYGLAFLLTNSKLYQAEGKPTSALDQARRALKLATQMGAGSMEMKARLVLAEIELENVSGNTGRAHLEQLERDAVAKDFGLIALGARQALRHD
jgi:eukaryotic-like serine/threonine-protein kinase